MAPLLQSRSAWQCRASPRALQAPRAALRRSAPLGPDLPQRIWSVGWPVVPATLAGLCGARARKLAKSCPSLPSPTRTVNPGTGEWVIPEDFPKPKGIEQTANYAEAKALSDKLKALDGQAKAKTIVVIGGGLSGLACGKYLSDSGHKAVVLEARDVLGGKVSAWQDEDGDWIETGLHIFFGAYPNMMNLFAELGIEDRLQWKRHQMTFAMQEFPGEFTTFEFPGWPAPLNMAAAILLNQKMLSPLEKLQTGPPLLPMLVEGQRFIDAQDECSVTDFCKKYGMPDRIIKEVFIPMAKALDFIDPDKLSMTVVLTAMNRFINETDGSQTAFLDGNQPDRLCKPIVEHIHQRGGKVRLGAVIEEIVLNEDASVKHLRLRGGEVLEADEYVSALPVDVFKRLLPAQWSSMPFFRQLDNLEGIPVINIHLWFDRKLKNIDALCFSRSPLLSVYADMSTCCKEYYDEERSMLELVFAPCAAIAGSSVNWIAKSDDEIVEATMKELERLFPTEIGEKLADGARLRKSRVVKVPRSVYAAVPGRNKFRPSQATPIRNFTLAGDWTSQKFLGSMEGAVLAGKLAAQVVSERALSIPSQVKRVADFIIEQPSKAPEGIHGSSALAFGGGTQMKAQDFEELRRQDPAALYDGATDS
ncbi:15-cis-phytoene desaturase [Durusdinium trenchii]|uniref:Amine oxidase n=1 Tax=Durusdinium trenchii TaxID=1381693 RepID=A0ABP0QHC1_9DINO